MTPEWRFYFEILLNIKSQMLLVFLYVNDLSVTDSSNNEEEHSMPIIAKTNFLPIHQVFSSGNKFRKK